MSETELVIKKRDYTEAEIAAIAAMHAEGITAGFLSRNPRLLKILYRHMAADPACFLLLALSNDKPAGFISGTVDSGKMFANFRRENFWSAAFAVLPQIFLVSTIKKVIETILYPKKVSGEAVAKAELLSMAVKEPFRRQGVAQALFTAFAAEQKKAGENAFRIVAGSELAGANKFYSKMGARLLGTIAVHSGKDSNLYQYDIS